LANGQVDRLAAGLGVGGANYDPPRLVCGSLDSILLLHLRFPPNGTDYRPPIGPGLLRDAILRTLQAADIAGIRAILVRAISERARQFYEK